MRRICELVLLMMLGLAISTNVSLAQRRGGQGAMAATNKGTYAMTTAAGILAATKTTYFSISSEGLDVDWFSVRVEWNATYVTLSSYDETTFLETTLGYTNKQVSQGSNYIQLEYTINNPQDLIVGGSLLLFNWATPCQADGSTNALTMNAA